MGYSVIKFYEDPIEGKLLLVGGEVNKGGAFVAKIIGLDDQYKYKREFLGKRERDRDYKYIVYVKVKVSELQDGDLLDIRCGGSWKNEYRGFYVYENQGLISIDEEELRKRLAEKLKKSLEG